MAAGEHRAQGIEKEVRLDLLGEPLKLAVPQGEFGFGGGDPSFA